MMSRADLSATCRLTLGAMFSTPYVPHTVRCILRPALLVGLFSAACTGVPNENGGAVPRRLEDVLRWEGNLTLQEPPGVITVLPTVRFDSADGFLVTDLSEKEIRRYTQDGQLLFRFGGEGPGPFEFLSLAGADRAGGRIYAADTGGRISVFYPDGRPDTTIIVPLSPIYDLRAISDTTLLLTGRHFNDPEPRLIHVWNLKRGAITQSFFPVPPHRQELDAAYRYAGHPAIAIRGNTIAATFALSDTLYFFSLDGRELKKQKLHFQRFRPLRRPPPTDNSTASRLAWSEEFSRVGQVFWSGDQSLYVQFFDMEGTQPQWRLLRVRQDGGSLFELEGSPRMLAVSPTDRRLYFLNPHAEVPNQWSVAIAAD